ncbi:MAG TPA: hypothetical protein VGX28_11215 [Frankiaceae bacterium]|jgi:hypothetical protein|nr:hypothetical protein [Frankiaceae bacterium]
MLLTLLPQGDPGAGLRSPFAAVVGLAALLATLVALLRNRR